MGIEKGFIPSVVSIAIMNNISYYRYVHAVVRPFIFLSNSEVDIISLISHQHTATHLAPQQRCLKNLQQKRSLYITTTLEGREQDEDEVQNYSYVEVTRSPHGTQREKVQS